MNERLIPPENIKSTIAAMQQVGFPAVNQQEQEQYVAKNSQKPDTSVFGRIAETVGAIGAMMTVATRQKEADPKEIEARLGLRDSRTVQAAPKNANVLAATGAALLIGSVDKQTVARRLEGQDSPQQSQNTFKQNREAAVLADRMGLKTAGLVSPQQDAASMEKAVEKVMGDVARRGSQWVVTAKTTTAFEMTQENKGVEQAVETTRMSAAEERLKELQEMVIATKGENLDVLMQYGNALHAKVYQPSDETGYNAPNAETIGQYANAINLIKRCQENEAANTMTMQPA